VLSEQVAELLAQKMPLVSTNHLWMKISSLRIYYFDV
jgi:hypothetical protein